MSQCHRRGERTGFPHGLLGRLPLGALLEYVSGCDVGEVGQEEARHGWEQALIRRRGKQTANVGGSSCKNVSSISNEDQNDDEGTGLVATDNIRTQSINARSGC